MWRVGGIAILTGAMLIPLSLAYPQEDSGPRKDQFPEIHRLLASNEKAQSLWHACPADILGTEKGFWTELIDNPDFELEQCEQDPHGCYRQCFEARNENACFQLGRALQDNTEEKFSRHWETMFAVACATGSAGGCTNRGAGIRNGFYDDDPFTGKSDEVRDACLFRTFEKTCLMDDPWGCTMHGMSFQYGEGVEADTEVAREFYLRSCALEPDFAACETAREQIDEIDNGEGR